MIIKQLIIWSYKYLFRYNELFRIFDDFCVVLI